MPRPLRRKTQGNRHASPSWSFRTKALEGKPDESAEQKAEQERLKAEFIARNGVRKVPCGS